MQKNYKILEAGDGEEALRIFQENEEKISVILLDVMMPKLDGGFKLSDFYVRRLDENTISISCLGKFLIKELSLEDVEKYLKIIVMYDEFCNINYGMTKSDLYDELLKKLLSFSHDLHKIVV